jgi:TonB family protein
MKQIVVMPGGFHPFHAGHYALYKSALEAFPGADVYVAATNDTKTRPFPFAIKEKLAKLAGVAPGRFVQVKSPFKAEEITSQYDPDSDVLIFVRSEKDRNEQPKPGGTKKDGTPSYFQPYTGKNLQPFSKHAYMAYLPTVEFGPGIKSATEIRNAWPSLNDKQKSAMVMSLYPATQKNQKLATNVVKLLDAGMGTDIDEDISRRGFLKGIGAAAMTGAGARALAQSDDEKKAQELRKQNLERMRGLASDGRLADPGANYAQRLRARILPNLVWSQPTSGNPNPRVEVKIKLAQDGSIISVDVMKPSGEDTWDEAFVKAIQKVSHFPKDSEGRVPPEIHMVGQPKPANTNEDLKSLYTRIKPLINEAPPEQKEKLFKILEAAKKNFEAANPAQQAAIAISMKKQGKKPANVSEAVDYLDEK